MQFYILEKFRHLDFPRLVAARKFVNRRLWRPHLRQHFVIGQPLDAVTAAEAFPVQLGVAPVNLQAEKVLPFAAAHVQPRGVARGVAEVQERVVIHRHLPEIRRGVAFDRREFAEKNSREINQVDALVNQFAAPRNLRICAPLFFVADATALAVTAAHKHHRPQRAAAENFQRLQASRMIAVIVAHANQRAGFFCSDFKLVQFFHADTRRLFD